jgi:hypothetical protein
LFANLRGSSYGAVVDPYLIEGDPFAANPPVMEALQWPAVGPRVTGKDIVLATYGFNVSYTSGLRSLARLEAHLHLPANGLFLGVLWPGDWIIPAINYPFSINVARHAGRKLGARHAGRKLGAFCNRWLATANSLCFVSHSLGARVILEAVAVLDGRGPRVLCITAGAVNDDCLVAEYRSAAADADLVQTLSSHGDHVLRLAYPVGDAMGEILHDDHIPFRRALGIAGPSAPIPANVERAETLGPVLDHGDYLPPDSLPRMPDPAGPWQDAAAFMSRALRGERPRWP